MINPPVDGARLRFVAKHYNDLQGLRLVPIGLAFVGFGTAQQIGILPATGEHRWLAFIGVPLILAAVVWSNVLIRGWYERRFGTVEGRIGRSQMTSTAVMLGALIGGRVPLARTQAEVVFPLVLALGIGCLVRGSAEGGFRRHYLAVAAGAFVLTALEVFGFVRPLASGIFHMVSGTAVLIIAIGDHLLLRRLLASSLTRAHVGV